MLLAAALAAACTSARPERKAETSSVPDSSAPSTAEVNGGTAASVL